MDKSDVSAVVVTVRCSKAPNANHFIIRVHAPLALNQEYTLSIDYQSSSSCDEEPHDSLAPCSASQYPREVMQPKQDLLMKSNSSSFDFHSISQAVSPEELRILNSKLMRKSGKLSPSRQLKQISPLAMEPWLFGEKYGAEVVML